MTSKNVTLVDTTDLLETCVADLASAQLRKDFTLSVDLEGVELCRSGRVCTLQITSNHSKVIWIVDVVVLGRIAFEHRTLAGHSLRSILQSGTTKKLFFDVRNDADALFHLFDIRLANVYDLQLLEVAVRRSHKIYAPVVTGLGKTLEQYIVPGPPAEWAEVKEIVSALCYPSKGGSYEILEQRPLDPRLIVYAAQDVALLSQLHGALEARIGRKGNDWKGRVARASAARVSEAFGPYAGRTGKHRILAPKI
ncbi:hypothetical protein BDN70DRAFT_932292 [Pholiota conissans]|uniref:3'-5' exonuclease domain-containing protein n=1 Tax=Pholiota conissans TaxID=109636 RepID=A0A9P5Z4G9_9AGAR|nr:hypothetical protein BDN70DRAFT_932292 [Pholiota conissans]